MAREARWWRSIWPLLIAAVLSCWLCSPAVADVIIAVDENGNGVLTSPPNPGIQMPFGLTTDPGPGGLASVLTYSLPASLYLVVAGDVLLQESVGGPRSDVVRFNAWNPGTGYAASLVFYSDIEDGADALADVGFPTANYTNLLMLVESGPEGNNGVVYIPTAGQPGYVPGYTVQYNITSDSVPEPGTLGLLAAGLGLISFRIFRRR
jgi:hypothetical protein